MEHSPGADAAERTGGTGPPTHTRHDERRDPLSGARTVVVPARQARPNLPSRDCPFCVGGTEAPRDYDVRWIPNRWPAMPDQRCEVVLYTPEHDLAFWQLGVDGARRVVDLWADRTAELGAREDVDYVLVFENRGAEVGATIAHPHGQIYAYPSVPPQPLKELTDGVLEVPAATDPVVVSTHGDWTSWVPRAAVWPHELVLAPCTAHGSLTDAGLDRDGLATALVDVLARLDEVAEGPMPYMLWVHQRPTGGNRLPDLPVHVHIAATWRSPGTPRFVAAAEVGGGLYFNPVEPESAAADLRRVAVAPDLLK